MLFVLRITQNVLNKFISTYVISYYEIKIYYYYYFQSCWFHKMEQYK